MILIPLAATLRMRVGICDGSLGSGTIFRTILRPPRTPPAWLTSAVATFAPTTPVASTDSLTPLVDANIAMVIGALLPLELGDWPLPLLPHAAITISAR